MNLGDGLLFELENGKPKLILLSHGIKKNPAKQLSCRSRAGTVLSSRQPSCVEEVQGGERPARIQAARHRETRSKAGGGGNTTAGRNTTQTLSRNHEHQKESSVKAVAKVKPDRNKHSTTTDSLRANEKTAKPGHMGTTTNGTVRPTDSVVCLTNEQLQQILSSVQTSSNGRHTSEQHGTPGSLGNQTVSTFSASNNKERTVEMTEEDRGGRTDLTGSSQNKDNRLSGCPFSWLEEQQTESRSALDAKKAQWRRQLDEQVALKQQQQQRLAPGRLQAEEDTESVLSVHSSVSHREIPAAIRSSLRLGEVVPMAEVQSLGRREQQRRRWLEELDRQRDETTERKRREKLIHSQTEDHELWASHFDSLHRKPLVQSAAPSAPSVPPPAPSVAPSIGPSRGEWEPSSSLSLVWDAMSSCGAESVGGVSVDTTSRHPTTAGYRTMTALLDPAEIEQRERRRIKQQEQQRAIEAQLEERRIQREREERKRKEEEEKEERRLELEREMLGRRYQLEKQKLQHTLPSPQAEHPKKERDDKTHQETLEPIGNRQGECLVEEEEHVSTSRSEFKDTAVQTEAAPSVPPIVDIAPPPNGRNRATGKENVCRPRDGRGDLYEAFARTDKSRRDKRRPEWNTQRPSRGFVPASERYPASLQRNRQESRLKRQNELLALQERACVSRADPPNTDPRLGSNHTHTRRGESVSRGHSSSAASNTDRGRSPPVPAVRHRLQTEQAEQAASPPLVEFVPYRRTDEVFNMDPLEPADTPPPHTHTEVSQRPASPPAASHRDPLLHPELRRNNNTHRQQEILRGLNQLRQGLLQKQRELETDHNPLLKRHDNELRSTSATHHM